MQSIHRASSLLPTLWEVVSTAVSQMLASYLPYDVRVKIKRENTFVGIEINSQVLNEKIPMKTPSRVPGMYSKCLRNVCCFALLTRKRVRQLEKHCHGHRIVVLLYTQCVTKLPAKISDTGNSCDSGQSITACSVHSTEGTGLSTV